MERTCVLGYIRISEGQFYKNGELVFSAEKDESFAQTIRVFYKSLEINYPAFYKMDNLSKLGFCAAELLLKDKELLASYNSQEIGILLSNVNSCLETDYEYYKTIQSQENYFPSPAVFVYTLPNIVIGEISIKHKIQGENIFFIHPEFDPEFMVNYANSLLKSTSLKAVLVGWVEYYQDKYDAFMYFASSQKNEKALPEHTVDTIKHIYTK
jgi:hypothetical protein